MRNRCSMGIVFAVMSFFGAANAGERIDWERYLIDGVSLSGNYDVRYLGGEPWIGISVEGKPQEEANKLVDGGGPVVGCRQGEHLQIAMDLKADRLVSGIAFACGGNASWEIAFSNDGKTWHNVEGHEVVALQENATQVVGNLALPARYLRLRAVASEQGYSLDDVFIYGDSEASGAMVGGIYAADTISLAGRPTALRAVIRNSGPEAKKDVRVVFRQRAPEEADLGAVTIPEIAPFSAELAVLDWRPMQTEPHRIEVAVAGEQAPARVATIPVVKRPLFLSSFHALDNARLKYQNIYTTTGSAEQTSHEYFLHKIRGRTALAFCIGPNAMAKDLTVEKYLDVWRKTTETPWRDGIAMDEWGEMYPHAVEALEKLKAAHPNKMIAAWLAGGPNVTTAAGFRAADLVLVEMYLCLLSAHNIHREYLGPVVRAINDLGLSDSWIIALGLGVDGGSATIEQIEREVRFIRSEGPEMSGVAFYGASNLSAEADALGYKYFIAPVCMADRSARVEGDTVRGTVRNIGGMTAYNVEAGVFDAAGSRPLGTGRITALGPCEKKEIVIRLERPAKSVALRVLPGDGYTALEAANPVEALPSRLVKGMYLSLCWTPDKEQAVRPADRFEVVRSTDGKVVLDLENKGWSAANTGNVYARNVPTIDIEPGEYRVRYIRGGTGEVAGISEPVVIVPPGGRFFVSKVNGAPHEGDPDHVTVNAGDTFEVSWDLSGLPIENPGIYVSPPGDGLRMPRSDGSYTMSQMTTLCRLAEDRARRMFVAGSWTWKTRIEADDLVENDPGRGWIRGGKDPASKWLNMSRAPGVWRLWMCMEHGPGQSATPMTPVVTIEVTGGE